MERRKIGLQGRAVHGLRRAVRDESRRRLRDDGRRRRDALPRHDRRRMARGAAPPPRRCRSAAAYGPRRTRARGEPLLDRRTGGRTGVDHPDGVLLIEILHDLLAAAGCFALWRLWRRVTPSVSEGPGGTGGAPTTRPGPSLMLGVTKIVGLGFLMRAFLGQALFWISYLMLPVGRSMQIGDGLWFFAADGWWYMGYTHELVRAGPAAIVFLPARYPSHLFVQILSAFMAMFGDVASVALFMNCAAYLATCAIVVRLQPRVNGAVLFAVTALAFGPG